jgi:hypothetical protein
LTQINLPHVLHTFDTRGRGRCILNVATDLAAEPTAPGYDAEALDDLKRALGKLIDRHESARRRQSDFNLVAFQPSVYHGARLQFCFLAWSADDLPLHLDARRMNGDGPLLSLDASADGVSYPPVFHAVSLDPNQKLSNASGAR